MLKLAHYSNAISTFSKAFNHIKGELAVFGAFSLIILYVASVGIYTFENQAQPAAFDQFLIFVVVYSYIDNVGYGDSYPITIGGKIFTSLILMVGLGIISDQQAYLHQLYLRL